MKERFNSLSQKKILYMIYFHIYQRIKFDLGYLFSGITYYITYIFHRRIDDYQNFFQNKQIFFHIPLHRFLCLPHFLYRVCYWSKTILKYLPWTTMDIYN